ncbi:hypothetical protein BDZ45DRAFT_742579 [Acephala macrosclerotiorum]|nr:hypothetical protein BDZ45DRAFT_742579 [Acephala macrosclerotiorum]
MGAEESKFDSFIKISKKGRANGDMIMHRENGTLVRLNPATGRAIGRIKATIIQQYLRCPTEWKAQYVKLFYEKDKVLALDGKPLPEWDKEMIGHDMLYDLPTMNNKGFYELYGSMGLWLEGEDEEVAKLLGVPDV